MSDIITKCGKTLKFLYHDDFSREVYLASLDNGTKIKLVSVEFGGKDLHTISIGGEPECRAPDGWQMQEDQF